MFPANGQKMWQFLGNEPGSFNMGAVPAATLDSVLEAYHAQWITKPMRRAATYLPSMGQALKSQYPWAYVNDCKNLREHNS